MSSKDTSALTLPNTGHLDIEGELWRDMVEGIDRYLEVESTRLLKERDTHWDPDFGTHAAYTASIEPNRQRFREIIGLKDKREAPSMEIVEALSAVDRSGAPTLSVAGTGEGFRAYRVRWPVFSRSVRRRPSPAARIPGGCGHRRYSGL